MRLLSLDEVLLLYYRLMRDTGGAAGVLSEDAIKFALAQPRMIFDGVERYPSLVEKAAAIGHSLIANHPFIEGNKRIGHAVMEAVLLRNGFEFDGTIDEQEHVILWIAQGKMTRRKVSEWIQSHIQPRKSG